MGWTVYQWGIATLMVITGSINTLSVKWANKSKSKNSIGEVVEFEHPFFQASGMFLGELACLVAFYGTVFYDKWKKIEPVRDESKIHFTMKKSYIFFVPAMLDMTATSLMYVGLTLTSASSFQMLRGAVIIFTGLASMIFLKRRIKWFQWIGMATVLCGLVCVAGGDMIVSKNDEASNEIVGDIIIISVQIIVACQMVYEEKYLSKYDVKALNVVGLEGLFGFIVLTLVLIVLCYVPTYDKEWGNSPQDPYYVEDVVDAFTQMGNNKWVAVAFTGTAISIAFFNFAGISVTQQLSATTRMVLDSLRTLIIWMISLGVGWQKFHFLHVIGFIVLMTGMSLYNDIIVRPGIYKLMGKKIDRFNPNAEDNKATNPENKSKDKSSV